MNRAATDERIWLRPFAGGVVITLALTLGFLAEWQTPDDLPGVLLVLSLGAAAIMIIVFLTSRRESGFVRRILEGIALGGVAGASLVVGSYLAYTAGLGSYAEQGSWSGEAGRSLIGFLILFSAAGALCGGCCSLVSLAFSQPREPSAGHGGQSHA